MKYKLGFVTDWTVVANKILIILFKMMTYLKSYSTQTIFLSVKLTSN